jgi:hypothetical protein
VQLSTSKAMAYKGRHHKQLQMTNWTPPLRRAHLEDQNRYIICPLWRPDDEDIQITKKVGDDVT